jgi:uncharacterized protein (TIGR02186 family)
MAALWALTLAGNGAAATAPPVPISVSVSEPVIRITPRYQGELVRVAGTAPSGCAVVVKLTSSREAVRYSRKGKVGPIWLSVGPVRFENVPRMFKVKSTAELDDIMVASEQVKWVLGRRGLKASMQVPPGLDRGVYLDELIRIREQRRLFSFGDTSVRRDGTAFSTTFFWPPDGPPDRYRVEAYAVRDGRVVGVAAAGVLVRAVGVEAWVRHLAAEHGIVYGLLAVLLAIAAGLLASAAFKRSGRRTAKVRVGH